MKIKFVIFYLDISKESPSRETFERNNEADLTPIFPKDWNHITSTGYSNKEDAYDFLECPTMENAITWIKGHLRSNHIYKICKWTIEENVKVFDNCPALVEVETE